MTKYLLLVSLLLMAQPESIPAQQRSDMLMNTAWKFLLGNPIDAEKPDHDDSSWADISLPHTWNNRDGQDGGNDYHRGIGWYRSSFSIDPKDRQKQFFLKFDGVSTRADVFVNGRLVGSHKGGFSAFCFDITHDISFGRTNCIAVKASNAFDSTISPLRGDFTMFGGIYRDVHLISTSPLLVSPLDDGSSGIYIKQSDVQDSVALVQIDAKILNASSASRRTSVRLTVTDAAGTIAHRSTRTFPIGAKRTMDLVENIRLVHPHLWNGRKDPYLYSLQVEILDGTTCIDKIAEPFGLRYYSVDPQKGFSLNGKPYRIYGVNKHQDLQDKGWALSKEDIENDFHLVEDLGATGIRLAHYQHAQASYSLCDRSGLIVWAELALVDYIHSNPEFFSVCKQQLTELIKQNYNHPSIFFWSLENELIPDSDPNAYADFVQNLNTTAKELDPSRLTTVASRSKYDCSYGLNTATDVMAFNIYKGWYIDEPEDLGPFVDSLHMKFPTRSIAISEYGAGASIAQHEYPPAKPAPRGPWHPEEWQSLVHEITWKAIAARPFLWGTFIWAMFDFASDNRAEGDMRGRNDKGLVTFDHKVKKDAYYFYKSHWNPEPLVHITSKRYSPRPVGKTDIKIYSNCDSVETTIDGYSLGFKTAEDNIFIWNNIDLPKGDHQLVAKGMAKGGFIIDSCKITATISK